ncbi:MAG TPA: DUF5982 domain-containing protein [Candidatus Methylomirabilis sp.]|nr:DUF5982 domain-containing protein [Candidatus Methylomirabilis sp.]
MHLTLICLLYLIGATLHLPLANAASPPDPEGTPTADAPTPPDFMRNKPQIPEIILKDKREGSYFTGIPVIGIDPESGVALGASVQWYDNGAKDSPFFSYTPYRKKVNATVDLSTRGRQEYILEYDQPYIADTPWRVRAYGAYLGEKFADYFGIGEGTLGRLSFPGTPGVTYRRTNDYFDALKENRDGKTWRRFNYFDKRQVTFVGNLEHDYFGGLLRPLVGLQISHVDVRDYTGKEEDGAVNQETLLRQDVREGRIRDFDGGWLNFARVGLTYDSRDYEPDPTSGVVGQALLEGTARWLGASSDYGHLTLNFQGYHRLIPKVTHLVLAGNAVYSVHFGVVPFFALSSLAAPNEEGKEGLGGWDTIRGYYANRFVGKVKMHGSLELRWSPFEFTVWNQHMKTTLVPFVDAGRVFDKMGRFSLNDWKIAGGIGLRLIWNLATIISFDVGFSSESTLIYLKLGHQF